MEEKSWREQCEALAERVMELEGELADTKVLLEDLEREMEWRQNEAEMNEARLEMVYLIFGRET